jgi:hypothetical protein
MAAEVGHRSRESLRNGRRRAARGLADHEQLFRAEPFHDRAHLAVALDAVRTAVDQGEDRRADLLLVEQLVEAHHRRARIVRREEIRQP